MTSRQVLPRWQLRHVSVAPRSSRSTPRTQFHSGHPRSQTPSTASADPIEALHARAQTSNTTTIPQRSLLGSFLRSVFYLSVFGATGFAAAWGWKTWMYLRTGQAIGEPATRTRNKERFSATISSSELVKSLRQDGWIEEDPANKESTIEDGARPGFTSARGRHMVNEKLTESGYLATKHFRHPTDGLTVLVFMADVGCESWPSTLHGGVATTVIQEALDTHVKNFPQYAPIRNRETTMNYRLPLAPGVMYTVLIRTDETDYPYKSDRETDTSFMGVAVEVLLNQMTRAPKYVSKYNEDSKTEDRVLDVRNAHKNIKAYVKGGSILFLASKDFREMLQKDPELIPALREKRDAWIKAFDSRKIQSKK